MESVISPIEVTSPIKVISPIEVPATASTEAFLNDTWTLSWHDPNGTDWTPESYKTLATLSTVQDFWRVANTLSTDAWASASFFLMREHIAPLWEDSHNEHGGCWSMKVMRHHVADVWLNLTVATLGETLVLPAHRAGMWSVVNGVSITPKRNFVIIRVWLADYERRDRAMYALGAPEYTDVLFKRHVDNDTYSGAGKETGGGGHGEKGGGKGGRKGAIFLR